MKENLRIQGKTNRFLTFLNSCIQQKLRQPIKWIEKTYGMCLVSWQLQQEQNISENDLNSVFILFHIKLSHGFFFCTSTMCSVVSLAHSEHRETGHLKTSTHTNILEPLLQIKCMNLKSISISFTSHIGQY